MALKIVGAGFGRTGTNSLKLALERLGFGPCHHMYEIRDNPEQLPAWQAAARGETPDWDDVFAGYASCVDWPSAFFWRELAAHYSGAKVLLSVRPEEKWLASMRKTIFRIMRDFEEKGPDEFSGAVAFAHELVGKQVFGGRFDDDAGALAAYRANSEAVQREIAPERLLTYDVAEGWEPLCAFLGAPVPGEPFPNTNTAAFFNAPPGAGEGDGGG